MIARKVVIVCGICGVITASSLSLALVLEHKRKEYVDTSKKTVKPVLPAMLEAQPERDTFGSTSQDPEDPVVVKNPTNQVDVVTPQSVDHLGDRFATTRDHRYVIYADTSAYRPGEYEHVTLEYWPDDAVVVYNGFPVAAVDVETMFGRSFAAEVLTLGFGRDLELVVFSTTLIDHCKNFLRIHVIFHEGRMTEEMIRQYFPEDEDDNIDPDSAIFSEPDEDYDEDEQDEAAMAEMMDSEELMSAEPFFDPSAPIVLDPTGDLDEADIYSGWTGCEWTFRMSTGFIYDEDGEELTQEQVLEWLGEELLRVICRADVLQQFPSRVIYVRNHKLKIMYEITIE